MAIALTTPVGVGCQSAGFRAASLPDELRVSPSVGPQQIQLAKLAAVSARSSALNPGDLLEVRVFSGAETRPAEPLVLQVSSRGEIDLPLVGPVAVAGLEPSDASHTLAQAAVDRGVYRRPNITLEVRERATYQVTVLGAVDSPGVHELPIGGCDVLSALAMAGGLTDEAGTEVEVLRQPNPTILAAEPAAGVQTVAFNTPPRFGAAPIVERIDLAQATSQPAAVQRLGDRDVVLVTPREERFIHVTGLVKRPDQFELPEDQDVRVLDAIALAGGSNSPVADKVLVIRQHEGQPAVIQVSIAKAKHNGQENLILGPGDLVSVESTVATSVVDTVRDFFRVSLGLSSAAFTF